MKLYDLTTNHLCNPLGTEGQPYFCWKLESEKTNVWQTAWRITVSGENGDAVWDSRVQSGGENAFHIYAGVPLKSRTRYFWTVTVTDNYGESDTQQAWFETGIAPEEWQARWMAVPRLAPGRKKGFGNQPPATLFRKAFALKKPVKSARLYATCRGVYRLYVNGMRPDDREFAPEHTSYRGYHCYQTYDVTKLLREGDNVIGFEVGDGWYCCPQTKPPVDGPEPDHAVLFQLEVVYEDDEKDRICSDEAVLTSTGEVCFSDLFDGEMQDLRLAKRDFSLPEYGPDTSMYHYSGIQMGESTGCGGPVCSAGWGDAAVTVPWAMYEVTGNTAILQTQYESMKAWCDYVISRAKIHAPGSTLPDEIEEHLWNTGFQFGEWLIPSQANEPQEQIFSTMAASASYTAPICGWVVTDRMAKAARVLNRTRDAEHYAQQADLIKHSIAAGLIDASGRMKNERQGAYAMMLGYDLVPKELVQAFGDRLADLIAKNDGCLDTGFLATPVLLDALCKAGRQEAAYALLYQKKSPSWLSQIAKGATTIWESWEMYLPDGTPKNESFNHYAYGCVDDWMFRKIAGIDQEGAGFRHLIFAPQPDPSLSMAARTFETLNGAAAVEWTRADGIFTIRVTVPCNTDAWIRLPDGTQYRVGSGEYTCSCVESL